MTDHMDEARKLYYQLIVLHTAMDPRVDAISTALQAVYEKGKAEALASLEPELTVLRMENHNNEAGKMRMAELLGCEDEPRWKHFRNAILELKRAAAMREAKP